MSCSQDLEKRCEQCGYTGKYRKVDIVGGKNYYYCTLLLDRHETDCCKYAGGFMNVDGVDYIKCTYPRYTDEKGNIVVRKPRRVK